MSLSMLKALRDGGLTGLATAATTALLISKGVGAEEAVVAGAIAGTITARVYRWLRVRWPWLAELDPPAEQNRGQ